MTLDTLDDLPARCRSCVFWELSPQCGASTRGSVSDARIDKEAWVSSTLLEWGSCGRIVYVDGHPAGFVTYAAPRFVPRAEEFPTGPASADAALLMTAHVSAGYTGIGLGRALLQAAAHDLAKRGVRALEAFGDNRGEADACVVPADFLRAVGFKTVQPDPYYPRLRLDLQTIDGWGEGAGAIDVAVEQWLAAVTEGGAVPSIVR